MTSLRRRANRLLRTRRRHGMNDPDTLLRPAVVGQQLFANFFNDTRLRMGLPPNGEPLWDWLSGQSAVAPEDVQRLQDLHAKVQHGRRVDLLRLHNLLVRVRTALT